MQELLFAVIILCYNVERSTDGHRTNSITVRVRAELFQLVAYYRYGQSCLQYQHLRRLVLSDQELHRQNLAQKEHRHEGGRQ